MIEDHRRDGSRRPTASTRGRAHRSGPGAEAVSSRTPTVGGQAGDGRSPARAPPQLSSSCATSSKTRGRPATGAHGPAGPAPGRPQLADGVDGRRKDAQGWRRRARSSRRVRGARPRRRRRKPKQQGPRVGGDGPAAGRRAAPQATARPAPWPRAMARSMGLSLGSRPYAPGPPWALLTPRLRAWPAGPAPTVRTAGPRSRALEGCSRASPPAGPAARPGAGGHGRAAPVRRRQGRTSTTRPSPRLGRSRLHQGRRRLVCRRQGVQTSADGAQAAAPAPSSPAGSATGVHQRARATERRAGRQVAQAGAPGPCQSESARGCLGTGPGSARLPAFPPGERRPWTRRVTLAVQLNA